MLELEEADKNVKSLRRLERNSIASLRKAGLDRATAEKMTSRIMHVMYQHLSKMSANTKNPADASEVEEFLAGYLECLHGAVWAKVQATSDDQDPLPHLRQCCAVHLQLDDSHCRSTAKDMNEVLEDLMRFVPPDAIKTVASDIFRPVLARSYIRFWAAIAAAGASALALAFYATRGGDASAEAQAKAQALAQAKAQAEALAQALARAKAQAKAQAQAGKISSPWQKALHYLPGFAIAYAPLVMKYAPAALPAGSALGNKVGTKAAAGVVVLTGLALWNRLRKSQRPAQTPA